MNFDDLKNFTQARVGLGHSGGSITTDQWLKFAYEHAAAVDAVHIPWDYENLNYKYDVLQTQVRDRNKYLQRPDLGRLLSKNSIEYLKKQNFEGDILITVSNGLSSFAVHNHLKSYLDCLLADLKNNNLTLIGNRIFLVPNARVALIDQIGEILKPRISLMLIGERPGLSSPDSLACYMTYNPHVGLSDANRNCISNIREPHGLSYKQASAKTLYLLNKSLRLKLSGVELKDESDLIEANYENIQYKN